MTTLSVTGLWSVDAKMCVVERRDVLQLLAAPTGTHPDRAHLIPITVDERLGAALQLDPGHEPGERASGLEWLEVRLSGRRELLGRFSPVGDPTRALLVTGGPAGNPWGARALQGPSGLRLASLIGISLSALLGTFETLHAEEDPRRVGPVLERLRGRHVVVAGANALDTFGLVSGCAPRQGGAWGMLAAPNVWQRTADLERLRAALGARSLRAIPHPSGRGPGLNDVKNRRHASATLLAAALDARGIPHRLDPWELIGASVVEQCLTRGGVAGSAPHPNDMARGNQDARTALRHLVAAWACLGRAGVTWEGSGAFDGWRGDRFDHSRTRAWDVDGFFRRVEMLEVIEGRDCWVIRTPIEPGTWPSSVDSEEGAALWATWLARLYLGPTNWERRSALLAAPNRSATGGAP